eukprot:gene815-biopygen18179
MPDPHGHGHGIWSWRSVSLRDVTELLQKEVERLLHDLRRRTDGERAQGGACNWMHAGRCLQLDARRAVPATGCTQGGACNWMHAGCRPPLCSQLACERCTSLLDRSAEGRHGRNVCP